MGELFALLTAVLFAAGVILFKKSIAIASPYALNLFKSCIALLLLFLTVVALGPLRNIGISTADFLLIFASGAIGVGISDTLFFMTLRRLGASRTALIDCLYSPFVILFSVAMLNESVPKSTAFGGMLILGSVFVSSQRGFEETIPRRQFWSGCIFGALSMATVALAIVMAKPVLHSYPLIWISTIRMSGGLAFLVLLLPFHPDRKGVYRIFEPQKGWLWIVGGTFFATYLSLVTWLAGFKYSGAGTAALLNQTSTVFIVVFAAMFLKEPMTRFKLLAVTMAFIGAAIILYA